MDNSAQLQVNALILSYSHRRYISVGQFTKERALMSTEAFSWNEHTNSNSECTLYQTVLTVLVFWECWGVHDPEKFVSESETDSGPSGNEGTAMPPRNGHFPEGFPQWRARETLAARH